MATHEPDRYAARFRFPGGSCDFIGVLASDWDLTFTFSGAVPNPTVSFVETDVSENGGPNINVRVTTNDGNATPNDGTTRSVVIGLDDDPNNGNPGSATMSANCANANADYVITQTTLTIPGGTASGTLFPVATICDDARLERNETIGFQFKTPMNLVASATRHQVTITDDETGVVSFVSPSSSVDEFGSPIHPVAVQLVPASSDGTPTIDLSLNGNVTVTGGTATQGTFNQACPNSDFSFFQDDFNDTDDFFLNQSSLTFNVQIRICEDPPDANETIILGLNLNNPGNTPNVSVSGQTSHTVTISDQASLAVNDASALEMSGTLTFTISLNQPAPAGGVSVDYTTASGGGNPATAGTDYTATSGTATVTEGNTSTTENVALTNDAVVEGNETFVLNLSNIVSSDGFVISDSQGVGTITDDDTEFNTFLSNAQDFNDRFEGDGGGTTAFVFRVNRIGDRTQTQTVDFTAMVGIGTATGGGVDFAEVSTTVTFNPTENFKEVTVNVVADDVDEADETFFVGLSNPSAGVDASTVATGSANAEITILDDDNPTLAIDDVTVNEADGTAILTVTLAGITGFPVRVEYNTSNISAVQPGDYTLTNGTMNFAGTDGETERSWSRSSTTTSRRMTRRSA